MAAWIVLGIGICGIVSGVWLGFKVWRISSWPTVPGRVISRGVGLTDRAVGKSPPAFRFEPKVTYAYEIEGTRFEGQAISYSIRLGSKEDAQKIVDSIPDTVSVHYNPENPTEAYLYADSWVLPIVAVAVGLVVAIASALWLLGSSRDP